MAAAASAPDVLHLGGSGFVRAHGTSVWRYLAEHPQAGATFDAAMATLSARDVAYVGQALAQLAPGDVCDIAGGTGALLAAALQAQPSVRGTLLERAEVLPHAQRRFAASAFSSRVQLVGGDLFALPPLNARTFVLRNVVHDWDDADVVRLLGQVRQQMGPQHTLALVETLASSTPDAVEALSDVAMLLMTDGGRQRSKAQLCTLAATLGMHCVHDVALPLPMRLLCFRVLGDA